MKNLIYLVLAFCTTLGAVQSKNLSDYEPFDYEVLFTNPECRLYKYERPIKSNDGHMVYSKPKNAYCKSSDSSRSGARANAPQKRLLDWIKDPKTKEVFMAYLSFSNGTIARALCNAINYRNIKFTLVIDSKNLPEANDGDNSRMRMANYLKKCRPKPDSYRNGGRPNFPKITTSGGKGRGGNKTGYAHNKLFIVNPSSSTEIKIVFSSGNMSSGTTIHHENWHFVTTHANTHFSKVHLCLMEGVLNHDQGIKEYASFIQSCKNNISIPEEDDIKIFLIPGEGKQAMNAIKTNLKWAQSVDLAAHRFSNSSLISLLTEKLHHNKNALRLIADDDLYWTGALRKGTGRNTYMEWAKVRDLKKQGLKDRYIQTYADDIADPKRMQLHHNKFLIFNFENNKGAVFAGAGNLTTSAFYKNFENFYLIKIPQVYLAFKKQYSYMWESLGRNKAKMPIEYRLP